MHPSVDLINNEDDADDVGVADTETYPLCESNIAPLLSWNISIGYK